LDRIRQKALRDKEVKFTALWHHVYDIDRLREAYLSLKRKAAAGIDGVTWQDYGTNLEENLQDLSGRLKRGAYRAKPVERVFIPKSDGRQRPIGKPVLEDKIVQRSTVEVLQAIYEADFKGFSYGFRPGRSQHNALDALAVGIMRRKVSWVLNVDIRGFFDSVSHEWIEKFIGHRIADRRILRHIKKWLNAGVLVEGKRMVVTEGTPQGGSISPFLANVYLHYTFDLWFDAWRKAALGDAIGVRFADDIVLGFQHRNVAAMCLADLRSRLVKFNLELHDGKTRLIEFGRFAAENRKRRGEGKPETFGFLGFTHACGRTKKNNRFIVRRVTQRKRLNAKLSEIRRELRRRMHIPVPEAGKWLASILRGHFNYYGVPQNSPSLSSFRHHVVRQWYWILRRRSQKSKITWERMLRLTQRWLPPAKICHPYPWDRLRVRPDAGTQCGNSARLGSVRGVPGNRHSYRD